MKIIASVFVLVSVTCAAASAQTVPDLQIKLGTSILTPLGGEHAGGTWFSTGPVTLGKTMAATYSIGTTCDAWSSSSGSAIRDDATTAWRIELTPVSVVRHAVRFRLRWIRASGSPPDLDPVALDAGRAGKLLGGDIELNLGPGESWPVDTVPVPRKAVMADGRPCGETASIRVSVERYPDAPAERRLIGADLWLIERLPDGTEVQRSQPLAVRGLPGRPFDFYFDSIGDASATLDIYGVLIARELRGEVFVTVETRSRWTPEQGSFMGPRRVLNSEVRMKPGETVEIRLPTLGDDAGPYGKRALSIRIRARQIR